MSKDHFVPQLIIKNFADKARGIRFYSKKTNKVSELVDYVGQLQKGNFHSKKTINELKEQFPHIIINPVFERAQDKDLESALGCCLETFLGVIVSKILSSVNNRGAISLTKNEEIFIREYAAIQHIRTLKFKEVSKEFNKKFNLPPEFKDQIIDGEYQRNILIRALIKERSLNLNSKGRFELEKKYRRILKKNPPFINKIREEILNEILDDMLKKAEDDIKEILLHPEKHSSDIVDMNHRNSFFLRRDVENLNVGIILNRTRIPFVLADTGIILMTDDPQGRENLEIFIPIHPNLLISLSKSFPKNALIDEQFVNNFNRISEEESYTNVYSTDLGLLNSLVK